MSVVVCNELSEDTQTETWGKEQDLEMVQSGFRLFSASPHLSVRFSFYGIHNNYLPLVS